MFVKTVKLTSNDLMENNFPFLRRGQWVEVEGGTKGQFVGYNHRARTVRMAWLNGRKLKQQNQYLRLSSQAFDTMMAETKERVA